MFYLTLFSTVIYSDTVYYLINLLYCYLFSLYNLSQFIEHSCFSPPPEPVF